jgi:hypothetical protein
MDKLKLTGQHLGRVFNSISGRMIAMHVLLCIAIRPNLELKTQPKRLLGFLPFVIILHGYIKPFSLLNSFATWLDVITNFMAPSMAHQVCERSKDLALFLESR